MHICIPSDRASKKMENATNHPGDRTPCILRARDRPMDIYRARVIRIVHLPRVPGPRTERPLSPLSLSLHRLPQSPTKLSLPMNSMTETRADAPPPQAPAPPPAPTRTAPPPPPSNSPPHPSHSVATAASSGTARSSSVSCVSSRIPSVLQEAGVAGAAGPKDLTTGCKAGDDL
jgi:hypothetical protein